MYLVAGVVVEVDVKFEAVIRPRTELHLADLDVEREVADVDGTGGAEDGGRDPRDSTTGADDRHCVTMLLETCVRTAHKSRRNIRLKPSSHRCVNVNVNVNSRFI